MPTPTVDELHRRVTWSRLGYRARAWRVFHASWSLLQLAGLGYLCASVIRRRRSRPLWATVAFPFVEGGALVVGHGDCPMGALQAEWGDPVPFFELVLPPRAAKAAAPILAGVSLAAVVGLVVRGPGAVARA
jgi:hypothetical protein